MRKRALFFSRVIYVWPSAHMAMINILKFGGHIMKKRRGFIGFVIIASVVAAALTGCSQDSGVLASDSNYSAVNVNVSMDYDALGSQIAYITRFQTITCPWVS